MSQVNNSPNSSPYSISVVGSNQLPADWKPTAVTYREVDSPLF